DAAARIGAANAAGAPRLVDVVEFRHGGEELAGAPLLGAGAGVDDLASDDGVEDASAEDVARGQGQQASRDDVQIGALADGERAQLAVFVHGVGVVPGVGAQLLLARLDLAAVENGSVALVTGDPAVEVGDGVGVFDRRIGAVEHHGAAGDQRVPHVGAFAGALLAQAGRDVGRV